MKEEKQTIEQVRGDGGPAPVLDEDLQVFKDELRIIQSQATKSVMARRIINEETLFNVWDGQSDDGRKHDSDVSGRKAFPFDGASDQRIRMADDVVGERVRLCIAAYERGVPKVAGMDLQAAGWGERMARVLEYEKRNRMGPRARVELKRFLRFVHGDSPAGCVMGCYWHQETGLRMERVALEDLVGMAMEQVRAGEEGAGGGAADEQMAAELTNALRDPDQESLALLFFGKYFPKCKPARARQAVRSLRETGECSIPIPYLRANEPRWVAHRLFEDIFFKPNAAGDFQRLPYYHVREWLTAAEVREKEISEGWDPDFITEVLKHEGKTFFPEYYRARLNEIELRQASVEENKGYYEILRTYFRATNDDGVLGVYILTWHHAVDYAAHERVLLDYPHGQYPGVYLAREVLDSRLLDSRGCPEMLMTDQWAAKTFHDLTADRASITTIPPMFVPANRPDIKLTIGPLSQIKRNRKEDYEPMGFPAAMDHEKALALIEKRVAKFWGQQHAEVAKETTALTQQDYVDDFLTALAELYWQTLQLCQMYLTENELRQITGAQEDEPVFHGLEEIQGRFGLSVTVNAADVTDREQLMGKLKMISENILPLDTLGTVQRDKLTQVLLRMTDPNLAAECTLPVAAATDRELADEDGNMAKIMAGVEPEMMASGQNFQARLERLYEWPKRNPQMAQRLQAQPDSLEIYKRRLIQLKSQVDQQKNVQIGRQGGKKALPEPGEEAGVGGEIGQI